MNTQFLSKAFLIAGLGVCLPIHLSVADIEIIPQVKPAVKAPKKPLEERVQGADAVFVGKLINKVVDGDWVRAELLVEEPLKDVQKGEKIEVIWRSKVGDMPLYDAAEGAKGIAILDHKHEGRYWLRVDKFEKLEQLALVKELIAREKD